MREAIKYNFEIPPEPIPESKITDTKETEVVVIGAGTAGLICANSAVENGTKVILISASSHPVSRGGSNHAINTKLTRELGISYERYNRFCETSVDEDFFKRSDLLIPVRTKPFYADSSSKPRLLIVCGGLRTNLKMQVLDTKDEVIPGLYAVGTIVGDMFANYYSFMPSGINLGSTCVTFGYLTGKEIANS